MLDVSRQRNGLILKDGSVLGNEVIDVSKPHSKSRKPFVVTPLHAPEERKTELHCCDSRKPSGCRTIFILPAATAAAVVVVVVVALLVIVAVKVSTSMP